MVSYFKSKHVWSKYVICCSRGTLVISLIEGLSNYQFVQKLAMSIFISSLALQCKFLFFCNFHQFFCFHASLLTGSLLFSSLSLVIKIDTISSWQLLDFVYTLIRISTNYISLMKEYLFCDIINHKMSITVFYISIFDFWEQNFLNQHKVIILQYSIAY